MSFSAKQTEACRAAIADAKNENSFPVPMNLAGWTFRPNVEKRQRWLETGDWLEARGLYGLTESEVVKYE